MAIENLEFDEAKHQYRIGGKVVPSVSDILGVIDGVAMKGIPAYNLARAADRGTRVHAYTEQYDYEQGDFDWEELDDTENDIFSYLLAYADWFDRYPTLPVFREEPFHNTEKGYACTVDMVKWIDGRLCLVDIKTGSSVSILRLRYQLSLYAEAVELATGQKIEGLYCLKLQSDGKYKFVEIERCDTTPILSLYEAIKGDKKI